MTQTDAEIVALVARAIHQRFPLVLKYEAENLASVAVAALTEARRLLPPGLTLPKGEKVVGFCVDLGELQPFVGDLDTEPTP